MRPWHDSPKPAVVADFTWDVPLSIAAQAMPGGGQAVYVVNRSNKPVTLSVNLASVGLVGTVRARDVWNQKDLGSISGTWPISSLGVHDSVLVRFSSNTA